MGVRLLGEWSRLLWFITVLLGRRTILCGISSTFHCMLSSIMLFTWLHYHWYAPHQHNFVFHLHKHPRAHVSFMVLALGGCKQVINNASVHGTVK